MPRCIDANAPASFNDCLFVFYDLHECKPYGLLELGDLGAFLRWWPSNLECQICDPDPLLLGEKLGLGDSLPSICCSRKGINNMSLSLFYLFQCVYFVCHLVCRIRLSSSWISLRGECAMCRCMFNVSVKGEKFSSLLSGHLGLEATANMTFKKSINKGV